MRETNHVVPRRLPGWGWALAVLLFYPSGVFIAFGFARLLAWHWAVLLALLSGLWLIGFVQLMQQLDHANMDPLARLGVSDGGVWMFAGWTFLIYHLGQRRDYWSPAAQRSWRWAKWLLVGITILQLIPLGLFLFLLSRSRSIH